MRKDDNGNPLPPRLHFKHGRYWYVHRNKWTPLPESYRDAMARYARLMSPGQGMPALIDRVLETLEARTNIANNPRTQTATSHALSKATLHVYKNAATKLRKALAEFEPGEVTFAHIAQIHDHIAASNPPTANHVLTFARIVFSYACRWGLAKHNPTAGITKAPTPKRTRYLSDAEFTAIRAEATPWIALLMDMLYLTAQRVGDVLALKFADVSPDGIAFQQQKTKARLIVALTPELSAIIKAARKLNGDVLSPYVFHPRGKQGKYSYAAAYVYYKKACDAAGVTETTLHDIRAKSLTDANRAGIDATALAGHKSAAMTDRYIRLRETPRVVGPHAIKKK